MLRSTLFALSVDGAVAQALRGTQAALNQTAPMSNGTFLTLPPPLEHCRRLSQLYHAHGCAASSTAGRCDHCKDDAQGLGICVETEAFSEICTSGNENSDCKKWLWGTETAQEAFFYLREGPKGSVYTFTPNETSTVDLLEIAHENWVGQEEATGLKSLYQNLPENETVNITLFWWNSTLFDGKVLNKNDRLVCTKRNVLRIAFGVQGGLEAARYQCDREPELSLEQKNDWTISRYSRTDIDEQVVKIICEAGHQGYYSDKFETPEGDAIWKDHEEYLWHNYHEKWSPSPMEPEIFVCDATYLQAVKQTHMSKNGSWGPVDHKDKPILYKDAFEDTPFKKVPCQV